MVVNGFKKSYAVFVCLNKYFMASWFCKNAGVLYSTSK